MSGSAGPSTPNVINVPLPVPPTYTPPDSYDPFRGTHAPLIIDNGASTLRFGFSTSATLTPHCVQNVIARFKERKYNQPLLLFGDGVEAESGSKGQAKTPWEGDVLLNFDALVRCSESSRVLQRYMHRGRSELTRIYPAGACTRLRVHSTRNRRIERRASRVDDRTAGITSTLPRTYVFPIMVL